MRNNILYFPYIDVPDSVWFSRLLLYWDEIGSIIPYDFIRDPQKLNNHTRELIKEELVRQIIPGQYLYKIPNFKEAFVDYLSQLDSFVIKKRQSAFKSNLTFKIHIEKMDGIEKDLIDFGLAQGINYSPWYYVEKETAIEFMSYLAATLGNLNELGFFPTTDDLNYLNKFLASSTEIRADNKIKDLRMEILSDVLPAPNHPLNAYEIKRFKDNNYEALKSFRNMIEKELILIADIDDPDLKKRRLNLFKEECSEQTNLIIESMKRSGFRNLSFTKIVSIISSIPGINSLFGLANAVINAFKKEDLSKININSSFLYAAFAQKEFL